MIQSAVAGPRVVPLNCRACRAPLPAASNDVAFRCPRCGRGWELEEGTFRARDSLFVVPPANGKGEILYLPYWSFPVAASAEPLDPTAEGSLSARDRAASLDRVWVSAYSIYRPTYVGEWGIAYTRLKPSWETRSGSGPSVPGAALSSRDASIIAHHYVLAEIDRAADLGTLDLQLGIARPELWAIPCLDLGEHIRCPWSRAELPASALDDLSEIRQAAEDLEA